MKKTPANAQAEDYRSHSVLVADDNIATLEVLTDALKDAGFMVYAAKDGREALELALKKHPDIILLDIQMPKMDGISMLTELRKDRWGRYAMVILLTHLPGSDRVARAIQLGAFDYLQKANWDLDSIVDQVKKRIALKVEAEKRKTKYKLKPIPASKKEMVQRRKIS
ncbi:MAG: response regulator [Patescibacteria group bacterium]